MISAIVLVEAIFLFNCRSLNHSVLRIGLSTNWWALAGFAAMFALQVFFTCAPVMNRLFHSAPISLASWIPVLAVSALVFAVVEVEKWLRFGRHRHKRAIPV